MSRLYTLSFTEAKRDIVSYLEAQDDSYFQDRGRTKEDVLLDSELLETLATEHMKCVNGFGNEREWSCQDACDCEPGIADTKD